MTKLFEPYPLAELTLKNRFVVAPMCQYSAQHGMPNDWHFVHLGRFALGGYALVIAEASAVTPKGRITYADTGIWNDEQAAEWKRITAFLHANGAAAGIQLAHAGRKASTALPWRGGFNETAAEKETYAFESWTPEAPSAEKHGPNFVEPSELSVEEIAQLVEDFAAAARRSDEAGFDVVEIHAAHGYLLNQFLSPIANHRTDDYGGALENRMRFPLEVVKAVRAAWPKHKPLFLRVSATDALPEGLTPDDVAEFAKQAHAAGTDMVHCSSGGFAGAAITAAPNYQVPLAAAIKQKAGVPTTAVGLIVTPQDAAKIIDDGDADLVAMARGALDDPNFPLHARRALGFTTKDDYAAWPRQEGYAVQAMDKVLGRT
ncbi:NADH:flavin oxidoreductase/NADH oxidase [Tianweitania sp. BSSL-BM11]|uniref:NADH:flavin oxidoreductase/NADH oxidase n=1 Tax=Tianweitania aestuarii TaxID=2814886 RepID=A0ABS5RZ44_9HYPH|nr:NADH:flavin oxidoreductase/NADH oxidase [Tianweitania aestuarii]MBS9722325.1 NADH:flavin oxidoreductase/NADH oxidase [Tianweitania aestuarii]